MQRRRHKCATTSTLAPYIIAAVSVTSIVIVLQWANFKFDFFERATHLEWLIAHNPSRARATRALDARQRWLALQLEERYTQAECRRRANNATTNVDDSRAWITALGNDAVALPAIVSGHTVRTFSCRRRMIALVSSSVSQTTRKALRAVGYDILVTESLDCNWMDVHQGRRKRDLGFPGTYMRLHIWSYEWLQKVIYYDPDYMFLSRVDELFDVNADFAAVHSEPPGIIGLGFNAGFLVIKPNRTTFQNLMSYWRSKSSFCPNDQAFLYSYFKSLNLWTPLPYSYNVRRRVYYPLKAYHFAGGLNYDKPWLMCPKPSRKTALEFDRPLTEVRDLYVLWWKYLYQAINNYELDSWWSQHPLPNACTRTF